MLLLLLFSIFLSLVLPILPLFLLFRSSFFFLFFSFFFVLLLFSLLFLLSHSSLLLVDGQLRDGFAAQAKAATERAFAQLRQEIDVVRGPVPL